MTVYFAYGSNMDRTQMAHRCPDSTYLDAAVLDGWRFVINERCVATITPDPEAQVHGTLWLLGGVDEDTLDRYEGVHLGNYDRLQVTVTTPDCGTRAEALVYVDWRDTPGPPRPGYLDGIVRGAIAADLPADYVEFLRGWYDQPDPWRSMRDAAPSSRTVRSPKTEGEP